MERTNRIDLDTLLGPGRSADIQAHCISDTHDVVGPVVVTICRAPGPGSK